MHRTGRRYESIKKIHHFKKLSVGGKYRDEN